jgi:hypothetical protein
MNGDTFWKIILNFFAPVTPTIQGIKPFNPVISLCILALLAYILIKGQRRYELLHMEIEALVRRYMIFRGKRHASVGKVQAQKGTNKKILKSISRSWYKFKEFYVEKRDLLERNYRGMRWGFIVGCSLLIVNTLREGIAGLLITELPSGLFLGILHSLPPYLLAVVGFVLLRSQKEEVYGTPAHQIDPALEAIFANFDQENPRLSEEFDPLEGEEEEEGEETGE